jgi:hypothetical protein
MSTEGTIYLSSALAASLEVPSSPVIKVRAGNSITESRFIINPGRQKTYLLSPALRRKLCLHNHSKIRLRYDHDAGMLHLGPFIGIFTTHLPNHAECAPDSVQAELIYLSTLGRDMPAQIYVFTPSHIDWQHKLIRGFNYQQVPNEQGMWTSSYYPFPDVVYDRVASRRGEARLNIKSTKKRLMSLPYLKYFNSAFLNKWKVHQILALNSELLPCLPETRVLNPQNLADMLLKYPVLFLKPSNGSLGRGIIRVARHDTGIKYACYRRGVTHGIVSNHTDLLRRTRQFREDKHYIVQQGIDLIPYKKASFDIRIIYQKNKRGDWQVSKKFIRVAPRGSSISNLSSGGRAEKLEYVFKDLLDGSSSRITELNRRINLLCQVVAVTLEENSRQIYGELGLDIGLGYDYQPWLLEVNSKPRKSTVTNYSQGIVRNSFKRPLEYAVYLSGFTYPQTD